MEREKDIHKFLKIRNDLEKRIESLNTEIDDLKAVLLEIDQAIVKQGFHQSLQKHEDKVQSKPIKSEQELEPEVSRQVSTPDGVSIQAKDGTSLGKMTVTSKEIVFRPKAEFNFTVSTPPFQSFLIDRVLENMKVTDESRSNSGEISPDQILSYEIEADGETIKGIKISNYGGERRLREIQSSLRWSFDKMYDKIRRG